LVVQHTLIMEQTPKASKANVLAEATGNWSSSCSFFNEVFFMLLGIPRHLRSIPEDFHSCGPSENIAAPGKHEDYLHSIGQHSRSNFNIANHHGLEELLPVQISLAILTVLVKCVVGVMDSELNGSFLLLMVAPAIASIGRDTLFLKQLSLDRSSLLSWLLSRQTSGDVYERTSAEKLLKSYFNHRSLSVPCSSSMDPLCAEADNEGDDQLRAKCWKLFSELHAWDDRGDLPDDLVALHDQIMCSVKPPSDRSMPLMSAEIMEVCSEIASALDALVVEDQSSEKQECSQRCTSEELEPQNPCSSFEKSIATTECGLGAEISMPSLTINAHKDCGLPLQANQAASLATPVGLSEPAQEQKLLNDDQDRLSPSPGVSFEHLDMQLSLQLQAARHALVQEVSTGAELRSNIDDAQMQWHGYKAETLHLRDRISSLSCASESGSQFLYHSTIRPMSSSRVVTKDSNEPDASLELSGTSERFPTMSESCSHATVAPPNGSRILREDSIGNIMLSSSGSVPTTPPWSDAQTPPSSPLRIGEGKNKKGSLLASHKSGSDDLQPELEPHVASVAVMETGAHEGSNAAEAGRSLSAYSEKLADKPGLTEIDFSTSKTGMEMCQYIARSRSPPEVSPRLWSRLVENTRKTTPPASMSDRLKASPRPLVTTAAMLSSGRALENGDDFLGDFAIGEKHPADIVGGSLQVPLARQAGPHSARGTSPQHARPMHMQISYQPQGSAETRSPISRTRMVSPIRPSRTATPVLISTRLSQPADPLGQSALVGASPAQLSTGPAVRKLPVQRLSSAPARQSIPQQGSTTPSRSSIITSYGQGSLTHR
jgi:hypothetical protein